MTRGPQDTSAEEPDGGNLQVRLRRGPGSGDRPGLLNRKLLQLIFGDLRNVTSVALALAAAYGLSRSVPALSGALLVIVLIGAAAVQAL